MTAGADLHKECVLDPRISAKMLTPLHYFAKCLRLNGVKAGDKKLIEVLQKQNFSLKTDEEKNGIRR